MIHALTPFAIRGAIWYQGESNRNDGLLYEKKMDALIQGWRLAWKLGDFPFYYVQLAPYDYGYGREKPSGDIPDFLRLAYIWEAQTNALRIPNTGMAVVTDIADLRNIHPANKRDVGYRLSLWARARTYGEKTLVYSGPLNPSRPSTWQPASSDSRFDRLPSGVGGGFISNDGQPLKWFEIAGEDRIFYKAEAEIAGDTVVVWSPRVPSPKAVRFGWHQLAVPNLANKEGLPASPFRTDSGDADRGQAKFCDSLLFPDRHAAARRPRRAGRLEVRLQLLEVDLDRLTHLREQLLEAVGRDLVAALGRRRDRAGRVELGGDPVHERRLGRLGPHAARPVAEEDDDLVLDPLLDRPGRLGQLRIGLGRVEQGLPDVGRGSSARPRPPRRRPSSPAAARRLSSGNRAGPPCPSPAGWPGRAIRRRTAAARRAAS